jgi:hypothetical protein
MSTVEGRYSPVYCQVEAYEEAWKKDHDAVQESWAYEDTVAVGISTGQLLERVDRGWRDRVFRATEDYCEEANETYHTLFTLWLRVTDAVLARVTELEPRLGQVDGAEELRQIAGRIREQLARWEKPRLSMAVGLREQTLSPEAAAEFRRLLAEAKRLPPEKPPVSPLPIEITAAEFFRRKGEGKP